MYLTPFFCHSINSSLPSLNLFLKLLTPAQDSNPVILLFSEHLIVQIPPPLLCPIRKTFDLSIFSQTEFLENVKSMTLSISFNSCEKLLFPKASKSGKSIGSSTVPPL